MKLDLIAASAEPPARGAEPLGLVLGIEPQDIERVLAAQREKDVRFGEAARALGLATQAAIDLALARQFGLACIEPGATALSEELVAAYEPSGAQPHRCAAQPLGAAGGRDAAQSAGPARAAGVRAAPAPARRPVRRGADRLPAGGHQYRRADHRGARGGRARRGAQALVAPLAR